MNVSYEHANPRAGNESFLLRIEEKHEQQTPCILVDAGEGVDTDNVLSDDEYLAAILLTHTHLDHYQALDVAHRDAAPILTSPGTAAILEDVLTEGSRHYSMGDTDELLERVQPISEWHDVVGEAVRVRPVPAGHAPGACGFVIDARDGDETFRALATGDFTRRDAGGYVGVDPEQFFEVDALFLTAATNDGVTETITDVVETLSARANAGSKTLCAASGLTGTHISTLLCALDSELGYSVPVILAGQVAKLYEALEYDHPNVETVPEFANPEKCVEPGTVTIAGPEVPVEGSSKKLFDALQTDGNATLVQVQGGATNAKDAGDFAGTVESFSFSNHPTEEVLDRMVETISPTHVVVTHQRGAGLDRYKDKWDSYTWATGSSGREVLYSDGEMQAPPWVGEATERRVRNRETRQSTVEVGAGVLEAATSAPEITRRDVPDLEREGIDVERLRSKLHIGPRADATPESAKSGIARSAHGSQNGSACRPDGGLYRTVGPDTDARPDDGDRQSPVTTVPEDATAELDEPAAVNVLVDSQRPDESTDTTTSADASTGASASNGTPASAEAAASTGGTASSERTTGESSDEQTQESRSETESTREPNPNGVGDAAAGGAAETEADVNDRNVPSDEDVPEQRTQAETEESSAADETATPTTGSEDAKQEADESSTEGTAEESSSNPDETVRIDPAVRALAQREADAHDTSFDTFVGNTVEAYLADVLRGEDPWTESAGVTERNFSIDADPALEQLVTTAAENADADDTNEFVLQALCEAVGLDVDAQSVPIESLKAFDELVVATTDNDECPHDTRDEVVQAAIERQLL